MAKFKKLTLTLLSLQCLAVLADPQNNVPSGGTGAQNTNNGNPTRNPQDASSTNNNFVWPFQGSQNTNAVNVWGQPNGNSVPGNVFRGPGYYYMDASGIMHGPYQIPNLPQNTNNQPSSLPNNGNVPVNVGGNFIPNGNVPSTDWNTANSGNWWPGNAQGMGWSPSNSLGPTWG